MNAAYGHVSNIKPLPSQGVTRIEIEIPIEHHIEATKEFFGRKVLVTVSPKDFGSYGIVSSEPVAGDDFDPVNPRGDVSDVSPVATFATNEQEHKQITRSEGWKGLGPLCQSAVQLCAFEPFRRWAAGQTALSCGASDIEANEDVAADYIRERCGVASRTELDTKPEAKAAFQKMMAEYRAWLEGRDA